MHCQNCKTKNVNGVNFCYSCGKKLNLKKSSKFSINRFIYKNIILSHQKHRNIFILSSIFVLCSALSVPICKGLLDSFNIAMDLVKMSMSQQIAKYALKNQTELFFRDVFLRIILILFFWSILILTVIILVYSVVLLRKQDKKRKNMYWIFSTFVLL